MRGLRGFGVAVAAIGAAVIVVASTAWACTLQAPLIGVSPASVHPAGTVTVKGQGMPRSLAGAGVPVHLRWSDRNGPKLAEVMSDSNGLFSATVALPDVPPHVYSLVAVVNGVQVGRTAVEVSLSPTEPSSPTGVRPGPVSVQPSTMTADAASPSPGLLPGAVVLGVGLGALFVGFTAACTRRPRRLAAPAGTGGALG